MKKFFVVLFLLLFHLSCAYAVSGDFVRITPETENQYKKEISVKVSEIDDDMFQVTVNAHLNTWFIATEEPLEAENQDFRDVVWFDKTEGKKIANVKILYDGTQMEEKNKGSVEIFVDRELMKRSYIYQDFPEPVEEGRVNYFTVDLSTYLSLDEGQKSDQAQEEVIDSEK